MPSLSSIPHPIGHVNQDDPNPRSPKRRRVSPPVSLPGLDIAAAAERALAESLDADLAGFNVVSEPRPVRQDAARQGPPAHSIPIPMGPPTRQMRLEQLPNLNNAANQILTFLARLNQAEIGEMLFGPPSPRGRHYRELKAKLEQAKRIYITIPPFLSPKALDLRESEQIDIIRKVNLASFMASIFSGELGLRVMDINFIDVFVPDGGKLLKAQASIYLELKTQAFVAAARTAPEMLNQVMVDLFPTDIDRQLLQKRPGSKNLAPSEQDFITRLYSRRDILRSIIRDNKLGNVHETYSWNNFAREVSTYLTKYMDSLSSGEKDKANGESPDPELLQASQGRTQNQLSIHPARESTITPASSKIPPLPSISGADFSLDDFVSQAARAAEIAMGGDPDFMFPLPSPQPSNTQSLPSLDFSSAPHPIKPVQETPKPAQAVQPEFQHYKPAGDGPETEGVGDEQIDDVPHSSQTAPTQVLYERARQASTNSPSPSGRKQAIPNQRRPWTTEEENALMTGIDQVKGPHWSQILAMYGPGGTVNESLKDRNQVQLKDKARNLKLFFLKANIEVPYYLQAVTGDLKSRAPGQAEKLEREKEQEEGERDKDDFDTMLESSDHTMSDNGQATIPESDGNPKALDRSTAQNGHELKSGLADFDMEAMLARAAAQVDGDLAANPFT